MKDSIIEALKTNRDTGTQNKEVLELVVNRKEDAGLLSTVDKIARAIPMIYSAISKPINLPKIFPVQGKVEVTRLPAVRITNITDLEKYFKSLENNLRIWAQAASTAQPPTINVPKIEIPQADNKAIIEAIKGIKLTPTKSNSEDIVDAVHKVEQAIGELLSRPTFVPPTVTNVNINSLKGVVRTSTITVDNGGNVLPVTPLPNRRSIIIFNNSAQTVYIGGLGVTTATGMPIAAGTYSPSIDAGVLMKIYGVVTSATADVRVLEVSNEASGN